MANVLIFFKSDILTFLLLKIQESTLGQNLGEATAILYCTRRTKTLWMPLMSYPNF